MPVMKGVCESLEWTNGNGTTVKTGALVTLNNAVENNATSDYINAMNAAESSTTVYFAYAFIGLRKTCRHCTFHWTDNEPFTYANWYGSEPNTYYYDCAHIRTLSDGFHLSYVWWPRLWCHQLRNMCQIRAFSKYT